MNKLRAAAATGSRSVFRLRSTSRSTPPAGLSQSRANEPLTRRDASGEVQDWYPGCWAAWGALGAPHRSLARMGEKSSRKEGSERAVLLTLS